MSAINNLPGLAKFNNATHETDGLMSRNDKEKLDTLHKSVTIHATLYASEWSANRPYTQIIDIPEKNDLVKGKYNIPANHGRIKLKITDLLSESLEIEVE